MPVKLHTLGGSNSSRFNVHRGVRHNAEAETRFPQDHLRAAQAQDEGNVIGGAVVRSERMKAVFRMVEKIARTNATVLIGAVPIPR